MDSDEESALVAIIIATASSKNKRKKRKKRAEWVKPWLQRRSSHGLYSQLLQELRVEEAEIYKNFLRMSPEHFEELLAYVKNDITKEDTLLRDAIPPEIKLAVTIRFLASGNSYQDLSLPFRVHKSTISKFVPEVCQAIYMRLKDTYLKVFHIFFIL